MHESTSLPADSTKLRAPEQEFAAAFNRIHCNSLVARRYLRQLRTGLCGR